MSVHHLHNMPDLHMVQVDRDNDDDVNGVGLLRELAKYAAKHGFQVHDVVFKHDENGLPYLIGYLFP